MTAPSTYIYILIFEYINMQVKRARGPIAAERAFWDRTLSAPASCLRESGAER